MAKAFQKTASALVCALLCCALLLGCALLFVGCESDYPEIRITLTFNDNDEDTEDEYVLDYKLYRRIYPQTVAHYLELADLGFYDGTVVHDYRSDRMVAGGYTYEDLASSDVSELKPLDYAAATTGADGAVTLENVSTWADAEMTQPLNRLYGETSANGFSVANGTGLSNKIGAIGTYSYITKADAPSRTVFGRSSGGSAVREVNYYNNSVTSMFYLYTGSAGGSESAFCVFGELANAASQTRFSELMTAISDYTAAMQEGDDSFTFTETVTDESVVRIADDLASVGYYEVDEGFSVPVAKLIITGVTVEKY